MRVRPRPALDGVALGAAAVVALLVLVALLAPVLVGLLGLPGPDEPDTAALDPRFGTPLGPSGAHPLGVDEQGRDLLSRTIYGARPSLLVAVAGTAVAVALGTALGLLAGWRGGWVDAAVSRTAELVLAFPVLLLGLGLGTACAGRDGCAGGLLRPGLPVVLVLVVALGWPPIARVVRAQARTLRGQEFVLAARALGASDARIVRRELLPNLIGTVLVCATVAVPGAVLLEAALSFLGVGVQPPTPSWGRMLTDAPAQLDSAPWALIGPGTALVACVLATAVLGERLGGALAAPSSARWRA